MGNLKYILGAVLVAMSVFSIMFCCFRGKGASHRKLVLFASMLGAAAAICFGGQAVLTHFGMGWRCAPFNIMLFVCIILFVVTLWNCMDVISLFESVNPAIIGCGFIAMLLTIIMTLMLTTGYFLLFSWHDSLSTNNGQTIVCARDTHGGSGSWRYYHHINSLIHGVEITQKGWYGTSPS